MEKNATTELTSTQGRWNLQQHCRHALCLSSFAELFANKVQWVLVECPWVSNPGALMLSPAVATPYCNATQQIPNSPPRLCSSMAGAQQWAAKRKQTF